MASQLSIHEAGGIKPKELQSKIKELEKCKATALQMVEDLEENKTYLETILANFMDTLIVINTDGTLRTINHVALDLLGYTQKELAGKQDPGLLSK